MTKARDLANIISGGFTESDIPNLSASKITSGSIDTARLGNIDLTNLSASNLTSGTIPNARVSASAVSQHVTSFDDNKIVNDISTLGLRVHTQENLIASNTSSASFDTFQDSSAISNLTNCFRQSGEFINTVSESFGSNSDHDSYLNDSARTAYGMPSQYGTKPAFLFDGTTGGSQPGMIYWGDTNTSPAPSSIPQFTGYGYGSSDHGVSGYYAMMLNFTGNGGSAKALISGSYIAWYSRETHGRINQHYWLYQDTSDVWHQWLGTGRDNVSGTWTAGATLGAPNSDGWCGINHAGANVSVKAVALLTTSHHANGNAYPGITELGSNIASYNLTANATASFTGNNITASSSTNKMGAVITYQDNAGTNALNTDIVLQLSADGGSNYSTATMTALPDFATGIKMAKVNDLSVTAGTSLKYKISFANQASGSKEARIRGVSLQY
jgi:hypothetical protein